MTVAEMIRELQNLSPDAHVWAYGIEVDGHAKEAIAQKPRIEAFGHRVVIDGGCV